MVLPQPQGKSVPHHLPKKTQINAHNRTAEGLRVVYIPKEGLRKGPALTFKGTGLGNTTPTQLGQKFQLGNATGPALTQNRKEDP